MKVIIPIENHVNNSATIASGFNKTEDMCIYDLDSKEYSYVQKNDICELFTDFASELYLQGVEAVISKEIPFMALSLFMDNGLSVYRAEELSLEENIQLFTQNELLAFSPQTVRTMSSCGSSCSTCETTCSTEK